MSARKYCEKILQYRTRDNSPETTDKCIFQNALYRCWSQFFDTLIKNVEWSFMLLGCKKSYLQVDVILYEGFTTKVIFFVRGEQNAVQWINQTDRWWAERDKDTSEQHLNKNIRNHQSLVKEIGSLESKSLQV